MEVGDKEKSEEMAKMLSHWWQASEGGLSDVLFFPTWRWEMTRNVKKWLKSYPNASRLRWTYVPSLFSNMEEGDEQRSREMVKKLSRCW